MYVFTYENKCLYKNGRNCVRILYVRLYVCVCLNMHVCIYVLFYVCMCLLCLYVYFYICIMFICMYE